MRLTLGTPHNGLMAYRTGWQKPSPASHLSCPVSRTSLRERSSLSSGPVEDSTPPYSPKDSVGQQRSLESIFRLTWSKGRRDPAANLSLRTFTTHRLWRKSCLSVITPWTGSLATVSLISPRRRKEY